jgi:arsenite methyltransferase
MADPARREPSVSHASSTGQALTAGDWLDAHFEMARPEYEAQLRAVGIQPGWRVLDAAFGSGSYLPWLAELAGPGGSVAALDLAPDNVALVERRVAAWGLPCPVEATVGTVLALPYPDASLDAVWFANTSQYLTDGELAVALAEFRRVVRPGGLVAVKESDMLRLLPAPPNLVPRACDAWVAAGMPRAQGVQRAPELPAFLRRAGCVGVWGRATLIERAAPLDPLARRFLRDALPALAGVYADLPVPAADRAFWASKGDPAMVDRWLDNPDVWFCEGNILAVGVVPPA